MTVYKVLFGLRESILLIISHLNQKELPAVVLVITIILLKAMDLSMRDVTILLLGPLSHGIHFRQKL